MLIDEANSNKLEIHNVSNLIGGQLSYSYSFIVAVGECYLTGI